MTFVSLTKWVAAVGLFAVAGCSSVRNSFDSDPNVGPCPVAASLYDASRLVEVHGDERIGNVGFTAEIVGVQSFCRYTNDNPITVELDIDFAFGRGPAAQSDRRTYGYFVTVTRRNLAVIEKETFALDVRFPEGQDRVNVRETLNNIVIPRANETISGMNFEILVGLELTEEELAFNRAGKRFRLNAGQQ